MFFDVVVSVGAKSSQVGGKQMWPTSAFRGFWEQKKWETEHKGPSQSQHWPWFTSPSASHFKETKEAQGCGPWTPLFITTPKIMAQLLFSFYSIDLKEDCDPRFGWEGRFIPCFCEGMAPSHTVGWQEEGASTPSVAWLENLSLRCCQMGNICNQQSLLTKKEGRKIKTENREYAWLIKILCAWAHNDKLDRWYKQTNEKGSKGNRMRNKIHTEQGKSGSQTRCV